MDSFKHEKAVNLVQIEKDINNTEKELIDIQAQIKEKIKELGL